MARTQRVTQVARDSFTKVEGLKELQAALGQLDKALVREMRVANRTVAETVAERARHHAAGADRQAARVAPSIKAALDARFGIIKGGGAKFPEFFGVNFGAHHDRERETPRGPVVGWNQFPAVGSAAFGGQRDRFLYRTIAEMSPRQIEAKYLEVFEPFLAKIGT